MVESDIHAVLSVMKTMRLQVNKWSSLFQQYSYTESGSSTVTVLHSYVSKQLSEFTSVKVAFGNKPSMLAETLA